MFFCQLLFKRKVSFQDLNLKSNVDWDVRKCTFILPLITAGFHYRFVLHQRVVAGAPFLLYLLVCGWFAGLVGWFLFLTSAKNFKTVTACWNILVFQISRLSFLARHRNLPEMRCRQNLLFPCQNCLVSWKIGIRQLSALLSEQTLSSDFHGHLLFPLHPPPPAGGHPLTPATKNTSRKCPKSQWHIRTQLPQRMGLSF